MTGINALFHEPNKSSYKKEEIWIESEMNLETSVTWRTFWKLFIQYFAENFQIMEKQENVYWLLILLYK